MQKILLPILFFISFTAFCQKALQGTIKDEANNPVAFANIYLPESKKSTVSNEDGKFYIIINPDTDKNLIISHLSYEGVQLAITDNFPETIVLKEGVLELDEVVIGKQVTGEEIALKIIENLKDNHDIEPAYYEYFTRVASYTKDWEHINLVEEFYGKLVHNANHNTKAKVIKSRVVSYNSAGDKMLEKDRSMSLWGIRMDNLLLYKPDFFKKRKLEDYTISVEGSVMINGIDCYVLKYTCDDSGIDIYNRKATAYVDKKSYALVKLISGNHTTETGPYLERNFVNIAEKWVLSSATEKWHNNKITTTLYTYLTDSADYKEEQFPATPFWEKLKKHNKNPNDTFWDNYQHIPLPE